MRINKVCFIGHIIDRSGFELLNEHIENFREFDLVYISFPQTRNDLHRLLLETKVFKPLPSPNKGRDMFPFLLSLKHANLNIGDIIVKWHDKRRNHLSAVPLSEDERKKLLSYCIFNGEAPPPLVIPMLERTLCIASTIYGWNLPLSLRIGSNVDRLFQFSCDEGWNWEDIYKNSLFPSGGIFSARAEVLLRSQWFRGEHADIEFGFGGLDGTWAHASERWLGVLMSHSGELAEVRI